MFKKSPHLVQYQGSKRLLAPQIMQFMPSNIKRLVEPFAGVAAMSIACAQNNITSQFHLNDINSPLVRLLKEAIDNPEKIAKSYSELWNKQFDNPDEHVSHYYLTRDDFNNGNKSATNMLYLLARCVKGAVRYCNEGKFNQSPDKRRYGLNPKNFKKNAIQVSQLLKGKTTFSSIDYEEVFEMAQKGDLFYLDPPYQGVSDVRDNRYFSGVSYEKFSKSLEILNRKNIDYIVSYDGACGHKNYGVDLPEELGCKKILLNAGISSQGTLLGKNDTTFEALYLSRNLLQTSCKIPVKMFV